MKGELAYQTTGTMPHFDSLFSTRARVARGCLRGSLSMTGLWLASLVEGRRLPRIGRCCQLARTVSETNYFGPDGAVMKKDSEPTSDVGSISGISL